MKTMKKNYDAMKLTFDDALLIDLFGTPDLDDTMDRFSAACTAFPDEALWTRTFVLKEQIGKVPAFVWPELYRQIKWNVENNLGYAHFEWDSEDEEDDEDADEDDEN